nr:hypothetical protein [Plantactinospora sp. KBS50]
MGLALSRDQERARPLYARVLGLRHVEPGGLLCFAFFEGTIILSLLLALAELVSWWTILALPLAVAAMVKLNDEAASALMRSAARVPERERELFRQQMTLAVGRAAVPPAPLGGATALDQTAIVPGLPLGAGDAPGQRAALPGLQVGALADPAGGSAAAADPAGGSAAVADPPARELPAAVRHIVDQRQSPPAP